MLHVLNRIYVFYRDGFRAMIVGRLLWKIIIIKLLIIFAVLKVFFFPDYLETHFDTVEERADHVLNEITEPVGAQNIPGDVAAVGAKHRKK